ncbi:MAG: putative membrane protein [Sulfurimonas sp.]|jgi:uncharacterized membrane protein|uniref:DUF2231 domain-containing protein n=1 Tax=Sulfurimonas sp. TaxID=2022749 RepID=UPI0039E5BC29
MLHPASAHFAMVLPLIALILGLVYLRKPNEIMSKISTRFMVFSSIFLIIAFFTGKDDGGEAYILLSKEGQSLLLQHKDLGLYLVVSMAIAALMKFYGCFKRVFKAEVFSILLLVLIAVGVLYQGKMGGDLTYTYGANVANHSDGMDCLEDPSEFMEEVEE